MPRHIAIVIDGNRRWARQAGHQDVRVGHRRGAEHIEPFLGWCSDLGIRHVTIAIGYSGRRELANAVREMLDEAALDGRSLADVAAILTEDDIRRHLYVPDLPDPDLLIRTSGEQRMSDFLRWQAVHAEIYISDVYWPAFRHIDFLRALRSYGRRAVDTRMRQNS